MPRDVGVAPGGRAARASCAASPTTTMLERARVDDLGVRRVGRLPWSRARIRPGSSRHSRAADPATASSRPGSTTAAARSKPSAADSEAARIPVSTSSSVRVPAASVRIETMSATDSAVASLRTDVETVTRPIPRPVSSDELGAVREALLLPQHRVDPGAEIAADSVVRDEQGRPARVAARDPRPGEPERRLRRVAASRRSSSWRASWTTGRSAPARRSRRCGSSSRSCPRRPRAAIDRPKSPAMIIVALPGWRCVAAKATTSTRSTCSTVVGSTADRPGGTGLAEQCLVQLLGGDVLAGRRASVRSPAAAAASPSRTPRQLKVGRITASAIRCECRRQLASRAPPDLTAKPSAKAEASRSAPHRASASANSSAERPAGASRHAAPGEPGNALPGAGLRAQRDVEQQGRRRRRTAPGSGRRAPAARCRVGCSRTAGNRQSAAAGDRRRRLPDAHGAAPQRRREDPGLGVRAPEAASPGRCLANLVGGDRAQQRAAAR